MPSKKASRYGSLCEKAVARRYGLNLDHDRWHDAKFDNGTPVEVKACMHRQSDGSPGVFRIFEGPHERLERANGWYAFVVYTPRGRGIDVIKMKMMRAEDVPIQPDDWYPSYHSDREWDQVELGIADVFR